MFLKSLSLLGLLAVVLTAGSVHAVTCVDSVLSGSIVSGYLVDNETLGVYMNGTDHAGRTIAVYPMFRTAAQINAAYNENAGSVFVLISGQEMYTFDSTDSATLSATLAAAADQNANNVQFTFSCASNAPTSIDTGRITGHSLYPYGVDVATCVPLEAAACLMAISQDTPLACAASAVQMNACIVASTGCLGFVIASVLPVLGGGCDIGVGTLASFCEDGLDGATTMCNYYSSIIPSGDATAPEITSMTTTTKKNSAASIGGATAVAAVAAALLMAL